MSLSAKVRLPSGAILYRARETPAYAYFLTSGVASTISKTINGDSAEVGLLGNEAVVGSLQLLGPARVPAESMVQIEATALRIPLPAFRSLFQSSEEIRNRVLEFVQSESLTIVQIAGCHRLHGTEERMARWLLMVEERIQSDKLELTQSFLALMLGIRRPTVTLVARGLQRRGLLELGRGYLKILNRPLLEAASCECYRTIRELYLHLYQAYGSSETNRGENAGSGNPARM